MPVQPHIIRRQVLNVRTTGGNAAGVRLQQDTELLYRTQVLPGLERLLDKYDAGDEVIAIDRLSVSLKDIKPGSVHTTLAQQILDEIERQLRDRLQQNKPADAGRFTAGERFVQCWLHYLRHGYLPWWAQISDNGYWQGQLEHFITQAPLSYLQALQPYFTDRQVVARIAAQLDNELFWHFLRRVSGWNAPLLLALQADERQMAVPLHAFYPEKEFRRLFRETLLSACRLTIAPEMQPGLFAEKLAGALYARVPGSFKTLATISFQLGELEKAIHDPMDETQEHTVPLPDTANTLPVAEDGIYIGNAGIVLVAPYLSSFFPRVGLIKDNVVTDAQRAVGILQYIISGSGSYAEFEMVLPKLLCGIAPETAVADGYRLTDEEKMQSDDLLQAVIGHWDALKSTSVAGLRDTFLRREGKLVFKNDTWLLRVQEQPFDILLDYLPWSFGMIRLPWMQNILQVNWR